MTSITDPSIIEELFHGNNAQIIALPGEPIVNIDAALARRKVNGYIGHEISTMMGGIEPALVFIEGRLVWRVPIIFTTPFQGQLGVVGAVDVDAKTSELLIPPHLEEMLMANADALLKNSPHSPEG